MNSSTDTPAVSPQVQSSSGLDSAFGVKTASLLQQEVAIMSGRFAALLRQRFTDDSAHIAVSLDFLDFRYREICGNKSLSHWAGSCVSRFLQDKTAPITCLIVSLKLTVVEVEMLLLAGLAEDHEGFADIFHTLHPNGQPLPTLGLAAQLFCSNQTQRQALRYSIESATVASGIFVTDEECPFFSSSLGLADQLWSVMLGVDAWPKQLRVNHGEPVLAGLSAWIEQAEVQYSRQQIKSHSPCTLMLLAESADIATDRAAALCTLSNLPWVAVEQALDLDGRGLQLLQLHCLARGVIPLIKIARHDKTLSRPVPLDFSSYPSPVIICAELGCSIAADSRPLLSLRVECLSPEALRVMWRQLLPELSADCDRLAARYPFEPAMAKKIAGDLRHLCGEQAERISLPKLAEAVRARSTSVLSGGIKLVQPVSDWQQLVLSQAQLVQLQDASHRLFLQSKVLDDWRFLKGRRGAKGVRMLFSGPPGTGKTLSAEVLAKHLGVDLLQVDLSQVVSKWIGETEKNLADVFLTAECAKAVLFFDEADALFGKRTDVSDAHDRYANLETAYLLSRLERYDGLAILATNYRQNIDAAFSRRLEFIVEFEEPGFDERLKLWRCHIPKEAPLGSDVSLEELASLFPIVGGHIRNAAVAAGFLAARENTAIARRHLVEAIRREYEKSGKAYREISIQ